MNITTSNFFPSSDHISLNCKMSKKPSCVLTVQVSRVQLFATPWITTRQASLSIINSRSLPKLMSIESVTPSNHLILCCPLLLLCSIFPSIRVFSNEPALHIRWPKYWSFSLSISPSNEYSGLISFRMDWLLTGHGREFWQNVVHWRREWQTISVFLPWEPHE